MEDIPHIALDLETLGVTPGAIILSIGAVVFDPVTGDLGDYFYCNIDPESCKKHGLVEEEGTVEWWNQPSQIEARQLLLKDQIDLFEVLGYFHTWLLDHTGGSGICNLWSRGYMDEEVLGAAYRACGLGEPWNYRSPRDARTFIQSLQQIGIVEELMKVEMQGTLHHALDDARNEARLISAAWRDLLHLVEAYPGATEDIQDLDANQRRKNEEMGLGHLNEPAN